MDITSWFDINNTLVNIPIGSGYALSWIEAFGTLAGLLCIWFASQEKTINYLFGLINVTLFGIIFYQIQLYGLLMLQLFFFAANVYGWYAWTRPQQATGELLKVRWLSNTKLVITGLLAIAAIIWLTPNIYPVFKLLAQTAVEAINLLGGQLSMPQIEPNAFPFWDSVVTVLSVVAQILMTRKYVENWLLWMLINVVSVGIYTAQGVYAMSIQYCILLFIAANGARQWMHSAKANQQPQPEAKS
ncbi:nicotinamide riboside transporter PnuC [Shewanella sp. GXUN23E]|uniref:nicotinamide riboside transporter PnuC n=1 Tax=Shewanella sp. GXUN23E TaxID=3422498 RepID=UPI003D7D5A1F